LNRKDIETVVPNDELDKWDAPMPPAKIVFDINNVSVMEGGYNIGNSGYFKSAMKTDIYYQKVGTTVVYTNPFYFQNIAAHIAIPAFINNGGYDWDSFDKAYGPYPFWKIINQPNTNAPVPSADPAGHPTKVEVYSDNHGEAMVWLNGNWNLNFSAYGNGGADVPPGKKVGTTTVQALADYPYLRKHQAILSGTVTKNWTWGGVVLGPGTDGYKPLILVAGQAENPNGNYYITLTKGSGATDPAAEGYGRKHVVFLWVNDRDGKQAGVLGATVKWTITNGTFYDGSPAFINPCDHSANIWVDGNGFLMGTNGVLDPLSGRTIGTSTFIKPSSNPDLQGLFTKTWGTTLSPDDFVVAAIDVFGPISGTVDVVAAISGANWNGTISRSFNIVQGNSYPLDDPIVFGDANGDGAVNMLDITAVERYILGLDAVASANADANFNTVIDMGDVVKIERTYLGLK
jgi:hypothetical protein